MKPQIISHFGDPIYQFKYLLWFYDYEDETPLLQIRLQLKTIQSPYF